MRIITPSEIERVAWEGHLEPLGESKSFAGPAAAPRVTLGEPIWWSPEQALEVRTGQKWTPPAAGRRYLLVCLPFTLHPPDDSRDRYTEATLAVELSAQPAGLGTTVAHDLYPQRLTAETKGTFSIALGPDLKFADLLDAKLFTIKAEIEYRQVVPVIQGFGLGEARPYWQFAPHPTVPLLGCQSVYLLLAAPAEAAGVRLGLELVADLETRFAGLLRYGLPREGTRLPYTISLKGA